jgi:conserved hypothetical protein
MSFSSKIKEELCGFNENLTDEEQFNILYGMMLFGRSFSFQKMLLQTEKKFIADYYAYLANKLFSIIIEIKRYTSENKKTRTLYTVNIPDSDERKKVLEGFSYYKEKPPVKINFNILKNKKHTGFFLRGVFLSCGMVINPEKEYHLEFVISSQQLCYDLKKILEKFDINTKVIMRNKAYILYIKESSAIEDLLNVIGAQKASFDIMDIKILKEIKNRANRLTNCETANIDKTVNAAASQIKAIELIKAKKGFDSLPEDLRELAELRLENPDMSLRELGARLNSPISRSGINHRINRLLNIAKEL